MEGYYGLAVYTNTSDSFIFTYFGESKVEYFTISID